MKNLRSEYLTEWRIWYNAFNKAKQNGIDIYAPWLDFEYWLGDVGPRPADGYQFCRDDCNSAWHPDNAGWRSMPAGRQRAYRGYYKVSALRGIASK